MGEVDTNPWVVKTLVESPGSQIMHRHWLELKLVGSLSI
jgi:hypothetical protein